MKEQSASAKPSATLSEIESATRFPFPAIDFKFVNHGSAKAVLWQFGVEVRRAAVNYSPVLTLDEVVEQDKLTIKGIDDGWSAHSCCDFVLSEPSLEQLFDVDRRRLRGTIGPFGETIGSLSKDSANMGIFDDLLSRQKRLRTIYRSRNPSLDDLLEIRAAGIQPDPNIVGHHMFGAPSLEDALEIGESVLKGTCTDQVGQKHEISHRISRSSGKRFWFSSRGFEETVGEPWPVEGAHFPSEAAYVVMIEPEKAPYEKKYRMSRSIAVGDVDRFHIVVCATKSAYLNLMFKFYVDKTEITTSRIFDLSIWRPRGMYIPKSFGDNGLFVETEHVWF